MSKLILATRQINCDVFEHDFKNLEQSPCFKLKQGHHQKVFYIHTNEFRSYLEVLDELLLINHAVPLQLYMALTQFFYAFSKENNVDVSNYVFQFRIQADYVMHHEWFMPAELHCDVSNYTVVCPLSDTGHVDRYGLLLGERDPSQPQQNDGPFKIENLPKDMDDVQYQKNKALIFQNREKNTVKNYHQAQLCRAVQKGMVRPQAILFCKHKRTRIYKYGHKHFFNPLSPYEPVIMNGGSYYWVWDVLHRR